MMGANYIDVNKTEKLAALASNLYKQKKVFKTFVSLVADLKDCVRCSSVTIFLFDNSISDHKIKDYVHM